MPVERTGLSERPITVKSWRSPLYNTTYRVIIGPEMESVKRKYVRWARRFNFFDPTAWEEAVKGCDAFCALINNNGVLTVTLGFNEHTPASTVVHECVHAVNMTFNHHGIELDASNDEHQAYYMTFLFDKCLDVFLKHKQKLGDFDNIVLT